MNKTKIDWADLTWNPVTGCYHECEYCYAQKIAERFRGTKSFPQGFEPTFRPERLFEPMKVNEPQNIFVCSMADLLGVWVPDEWLMKVLDACESAPQHNYLFLTKNSARYSHIGYRYHLPELKNMWYGWSVTTQRQLYSSPIGLMMHHKTFISIEPLLEPFTDIHFGTDWVIVGAETGNRKDKVVPKKVWIDIIVDACRAEGIPLFMKESLKDLMGDEFVQEFPEELKHETE